MISVIIPTYNHLEDCLKPCINSILKYTTMDKNQIEFIIVSNGSTDGTNPYLKDLAFSDLRFKPLIFKEPLGYTKATNEGLKIARGNCILFLNNDIELLHQKPNEWLQMLYKPLIDSKEVGMTSPIVGFCVDTGRSFPIFFCAMTTKKHIKEIGLLDEIFTPGGGEDCDWGHKLENKGYKIVQVPALGELPTDSTGNYSVGGFPIWHKAERTVHDPNCVKDWSSVLNKNTEILRDRYTKEGKIKLNLGCGRLKFDTHFNIDVDPSFEPDIIRDCRDLSIFLTGAVDEIQAIHVLEHFQPFGVIDILKEWHRVLKPGGILILELPDILENCKQFEQADFQKRYELLNVIYGGVTPEYPHRWGWWDEELISHLLHAGFSSAKRGNLVFTGHWGYNMRIEAIK